MSAPKISTNFVLPEVLPPHELVTGLDHDYWEGLRNEKLVLQKCNDCGNHQHLPELICHKCHSKDYSFVEVDPAGRLYSWARVWHPPHPDLTDSVPYFILIVEIVAQPHIRLVGNFVGDQQAELQIGEELAPVFEHHKDYSLLQWRRPGQ